MPSIAGAGSGKKFNASSEATLSKPPGRRGSASIPATTNEMRGSVWHRRA
jgi:hypothetical protein